MDAKYMAKKSIKSKKNQSILGKLRNRIANMSRLSLIVGGVVGVAAAYGVAASSFANKNPDCLNNNTANTSYSRTGNVVTATFKMPHQCFTDEIDKLVNKEKVREAAYKKAYDNTYREAKKKNKSNKEADKLATDAGKEAGQRAVDKAVAEATPKALKAGSRPVSLTAFAIQDGNYQNAGPNQLQVAAKTMTVTPPEKAGDSPKERISITLPDKVCAYQVDLFRHDKPPAQAPGANNGVYHNLGAVVYNAGVPCKDATTTTPQQPEEKPTCKDGSPVPENNICPNNKCYDGSNPVNGKCPEPPKTCSNGKPIPKDGKCDAYTVTTIVDSSTPLNKSAFTSSKGGPSALPDTGPGAIVGTFVAVTALSSIAFEVISSRLRV